MDRNELMRLSNIEYEMPQNIFDDIMKFIKTIQEINVDNEKEFSYNWINLQIEEDKFIKNNNGHTFDQNSDGFFEVRSVVKVG